MTCIFEVFNIPISNDDEIVKLKSTDMYNHLSLRRMGYICSNRIWKRDEGQSTNEDNAIDRDQSNQPSQSA